MFSFLVFLQPVWHSLDRKSLFQFLLTGVFLPGWERSLRHRLRSLEVISERFTGEPLHLHIQVVQESRGNASLARFFMHVLPGRSSGADPGQIGSLGWLWDARCPLDEVEEVAGRRRSGILLLPPRLRPGWGDDGNETNQIEPVSDFSFPSLKQNVSLNICLIIRPFTAFFSLWDVISACRSSFSCEKTE